MCENPGTTKRDVITADGAMFLRERAEKAEARVRELESARDQAYAESAFARGRVAELEATIRRMLITSASLATWCNGCIIEDYQAAEMQRSETPNPHTDEKAALELVAEEAWSFLGYCRAAVTGLDPEYEPKYDDAMTRLDRAIQVWRAVLTGSEP